MKISAMRTVDLSVLTNPNVQAILRVIRTGEGTADEAGYRRIFGGQMFTSYDDHPRITVTKSGYKSTAAGAYQMLASTWDETRKMMGLSDFSPASQDAAAVGRIAARGALPDVLAGRFDVAIKKIAKEWASLPGSPYGQPVMTIDKARQIYAMAGGETTTAVA
ncbi:glycoside hydrolase family 24 protein [Noviherbaspirillum sp. Root189]|uniref:glycoside hydrolase family 24 protein n=1 Tax=Noviherbaspirillum sp. Root189 TaxID=1736487 RepID=UPI001F2A3DAC|nr:glycoside hydrolase family 104 protein [Noviherbaspirillum sp. Root189]